MVPVSVGIWLIAHQQNNVLTLRAVCHIDSTLSSKWKLDLTTLSFTELICVFLVCAAEIDEWQYFGVNTGSFKRGIYAFSHDSIFFSRQTKRINQIVQIQSAHLPGFNFAIASSLRDGPIRGLDSSFAGLNNTASDLLLIWVRIFHSFMLSPLSR